MEDPRWLRLITIGLVVTALAVGYFLLSGRMVSNSTVKTPESATPSASILGRNVQATSSPGASSTPRSTPLSAYDRIASRNQQSQPQTQSQLQSPTQAQSQSQTLPKTGFSYLLAGIFSIGILISGWGLRKFPH